MRRNHILIALVVLMLALTAVPVAYAQDVEDVQIEDIIAALGPREGNDLLFDILLYAIFFMSIITMFVLPEKQMLPTMLNFTVLLLTILAKVLIDDGPDAILEPTDLPVLGINAGIFVLPLIIAGMARSRRGSPPALKTGIVTGLLGGAYFFLFWFLKQRDYVSDETVAALFEHVLAWVRVF